MQTNLIFNIKSFARSLAFIMRLKRKLRKWPINWSWSFTLTNVYCLFTVCPTLSTLSKVLKNLKLTLTCLIGIFRERSTSMILASNFHLAALIKKMCLSLEKGNFFFVAPEAFAVFSSGLQACRAWRNVCTWTSDLSKDAADPLLSLSTLTLNGCRLGFEFAGVNCGGEWPCFGVNGVFAFPKGLGLNFKLSAAKKNCASFGWRNHTNWFLSPSVNSMTSSSNVEISCKGEKFFTSVNPLTLKTFQGKDIEQSEFYGMWWYIFFILPVCGMFVSWT